MVAAATHVHVGLDHIDSDQGVVQYFSLLTVSSDFSFMLLQNFSSKILSTFVLCVRYLGGLLFISCVFKNYLLFLQRLLIFMLRKNFFFLSSTPLCRKWATDNYYTFIIDTKTNQVFNITNSLLHCFWINTQPGSIFRTDNAVSTTRRCSGNSSTPFHSLHVNESS